MLDDYTKCSKKQALEYVRQHGYLLQYLSDELKDDYDVVLSALKENPSTFKYASERLRDNKELALISMKDFGYSLEFASCRLKSDKEVVLTAVTRDGFALEYASDELKNDKDVVLRAIESGKFCYSDFGSTIKKDREICINAFTKDQDLSTPLYELECDINEEFLCDALSRNGMKLKVVGAIWQRNKNVVISAIKENPDALQFANKRLRESPEILKYITGDVIEAIPDEKTKTSANIKADVKVNVNTSVNANDKVSIKDEEKKLQETITIYDILNESTNIDDSSNIESNNSNDNVKDTNIVNNVKTQNTENNNNIENTEKTDTTSTTNNLDREKIIEQLKRGLNYSTLDEKYKEDKEIAMVALKKNADNIKYISQNLKKDKDIGLQATLDGHVLNFKYISDNLKNDREFVLTVLTYYNPIDFPGRTLSIYDNISKNLRGDKEIALIALEGNPACFGRVSDKLKDDLEIVTIVAKSGFYSSYIDDKFTGNKDFILNILEEKGDNRIPWDNVYSLIKNTSFKLRDDKDVMLSAIKIAPDVINLASSRLLNDEDFILCAVKENDYVRYHMPDKYKDTIKKLLS